MDQRIIKNIMNGDERGYTVLFKRHYWRVFNYISQIIYNRLDVEDLTMVTFDKAFRQLDTWRDTGKFTTWLIQIAKYTAYDFISAQRIRVQGTDDIMNYRSLHDSGYSPYQIAVKNELDRLLRGEIRKLPTKSRAVMELSYEGYTNEEIAEKLSMIHGNVRCIISRARDRMEPLKKIVYEGGACVSVN
jgi:RNA polymerase sigma-70 factor (ECF subfamily)